ncbi:MAG TPA: diguanylate cyclase [Oxalobacteraceae bacterium]|nr:diguanylate cyclase [Oxalobacteraceae bacterium]
MPKITPEQLAAEWRALLRRFQEPVPQRVRALVERHRDALASHFYEQLLQDPVASRIISHEQVKARLHDSMMRWLDSIFTVDPDADLQALIAQQIHIGEVHARVEVPVYLVLRGARHLKKKFHDLLEADPTLEGRQQFEAARLVSGLLDVAMEILSFAYAGSHDRNSRAAEAYRLFSVVQNVSTERERQRAALLDWENQLMFALAVGLEADQLPSIGTAEFGLWFRHKGAHAFLGAAETEFILQAMDRIDQALLPAFNRSQENNAQQRVQQLRELREQTKAIGFHLDTLFQQNSELEAGRDALTRLLNRKFLPVVFTKEVDYARERDASFAVLAIDVDHFKQVNDNYGHEAGDMVLQQVAVLISNNSRGGDYIFRLGGEEFLVLLVDVDSARALKAAEKLRRQIAEECFHLPLDRTLAVTISIGVAVYDSQPDYRQMLRRADAALYRAKNEGRNRVVLADD